MDDPIMEWYSTAVGGGSGAIETVIVVTHRVVDIYAVPLHVDI